MNSTRPSTGRRPNSIRSRAAVAFGSVATAVTAALAIAVWLSVSHYLLVQRERATLAQTAANAAQVQRGLVQPGISSDQMLAQLTRETGSTSLLVDDGMWRTTTLRIGREALPAELRDAVLSGIPSRQRIEIDGRPALVVGLPLAGVDDAYFEVFPLEELDRTYRALGLGLAAAVIVVVPVSLVLGWWVIRPALRPLDRIATAARAIAAGDLGARIDPRGDPALLPIADSFNATAAALQQRVLSDVRFAADVSHELRTPLTTMLSAVELVEASEERLPDFSREGLALLSSEVRHFERLVADLLEISRADADRGDLSLEPVRLPELVRAAVSRRPPARGPVPAVTLAEGAGDVVVCVDKRRLDLVITNLMDNADKHGQGLTAVSLETVDGVARILVDDRGPGIPPDDRTRVFERFARGTGSTRATSNGSGLGLALVARHVALMGGTVGVTDNPEGGARFVVEFPVYHPPLHP